MLGPTQYGVSRFSKNSRRKVVDILADAGAVPARSTTGTQTVSRGLSPKCLPKKRMSAGRGPVIDSTWGMLGDASSGRPGVRRQTAQTINAKTNAKVIPFPAPVASAMVPLAA